METAEVNRKRDERRTNFLLNESTGFSTTGWYFDNPTAIAQGQSEFRRIWGDRPLEDHWRRSSKQVFRNYDEQAGLATEDPTQVAMQDPAEVAAAIEARLTQRINDIMVNIPFTVEAKQESLKAIEKAYYRLGNIYYFDLEEEENAVAIFENLYERFPNSSYTPEVLYELILIYQKSDDPRGLELRKLLLNDYPNSLYAQLLINPDYTLQNSQNEAITRKSYAEAYQLYQQNDFAFALVKVDSALNAFPETDFTPRLELLKILILGKNETKDTYEGRLDKFIAENPDHEITPFATSMLEKSKSYASDGKTRIQYLENRNEEHYFVVLYTDSMNLQEIVNRKIQDYNGQKWNNYRLKLSSLALDNHGKMALVTSFENGKQAYDYLKDHQRNSVLDRNMFTGKSYTFVITKHNFDILYQTGNVEEYMYFFEKNYRNGIFEEGQ